MQVVDHDVRRQEIADVALDLIAREGLEATTLNRIAKEMGASIRVITHYYRDKDTLLLWVYRTMTEQSQRHIAEAMERDPDDLAGVLMALSCGDDETLKRWRVYVAFWDKAARSPAFAQAQRKGSDEALDLVSAIIRRLSGARRDPRQAATELIALVYGISVQRILDPASWTPDAIEKLICRRVRDLELSQD